MTHRLTRIYTRTGDQGTTGLADGSRVPKDHLRIEVLGCLDELNSQLGVVAAHRDQVADEDLNAELRLIQHRLFNMGAEFALPGTERIAAADIDQLESALDARNNKLPPLREFILPGGGLAAAHCHLARATCRRTERRLVQLGGKEPINPRSLEYLNRLSDLLFVYARVLARNSDGEVYWQPGIES